MAYLLYAPVEEHIQCIIEQNSARFNPNPANLPDVRDESDQNCEEI